jgi:hypothetical protein
MGPISSSKTKTTISDTKIAKRTKNPQKTFVRKGRRSAEAQELDLCLWRAAEIELKVRGKLDAERRKKDEQTKSDQEIH